MTGNDEYTGRSKFVFRDCSFASGIVGIVVAGYCLTCYFQQYIRCRPDRMVVGLATTCAISAYHH